MILNPDVNKGDVLRDDESLNDADLPPAYSSISSHPTVAAHAAHEKIELVSEAGPSTPSSSGSTLLPRTPPTQSKSAFRNAAAWFSFGALSRTDRDVKATIIGLVRDVVKNPSSSAGVSILQSCAEAARARNLSIEDILQEKSIEGHTPLYWAIVNSDLSSNPPSSTAISILDVLLSFPLKPATRSDACAACTVESANSLFQWLSHSPGWSRSQSGAEEVLLGQLPKDNIVVEHDPDAADTGAFKATFHVPAFQKRLRVLKLIKLDFIARERMWALSFHGQPSVQSWDSSEKVTLRLLEHSPPTPFHGRLRISPAHQTSAKKLDQLVIKLTSHGQLMQPHSGNNDWGHPTAKLDDVARGISLRHDGSSYINEDGSLDIVLEGALTRNADSECIII